ncbi:craniofacial development protein 1 isoform X2 [Hyalella azteca]|uniref:Craniofacial development protein 1 n=1 Tax=Hyalella azteca TaxID=294128 RepID=A0A8B7PEJ3_HYAAZ|nr:craniofacial development protein 1 isoform X2 [Hyalella azteca]
MLNEEEFDSDSTDEDYIPTVAKGSDDDLSSDESELDEEDKVEDDVAQTAKRTKSKESKKTSNGKKRKSNTKTVKQRVNPLLAQLGNQDECGSDQVNAIDSTEDKAEGKDQKKEEDLWANFLADTEEVPKPEPPVKPKKKSWAELLGNKKAKSSSNNDSETPKSSSSLSGQVSAPAKAAVSEPKVPATVKVTKIFEFAGEEVRVEEEVAANSKEAMLAPSAAASSGCIGSKRSSNLSALVNSLGNKKQKLSTLEKTKLDWQSYKTEQGLTDELLLHTKSKDTYLDKQEFLQRADVRQFELERDVRLGVRRNNR